MAAPPEESSAPSTSATPAPATPTPEAKRGLFSDTFKDLKLEPGDSAGSNLRSCRWERCYFQIRCQPLLGSNAAARSGNISTQQIMGSISSAKCSIQQFKSFPPWMICAWAAVDDFVTLKAEFDLNGPLWNDKGYLACSDHKGQCIWGLT
ncbi:hypothetical protein BDV26DRAFT_297710 [Aspergillus bertholletiae]|uniref:Cyanovirin-N domain-containing protein n=1 Tax=Aspergillus bertholletiae TaxID=1226010 RepID=A0A5N7AUB4_9EURO|nr:hypothetical protein BDV26DRAFT_297710 [Aspergillus bertholletiae]